MNFGDPRVPLHIWSRLIPEPNSGCWLWLAALHSMGYGVARVDGQTLYVGHVILEASRREVPPGHQVKWGCGVRSCVNPQHMLVLTRKAINRSTSEALKRHCRHGHEFTPGNTYYRWGGGRGCRACFANRQKLSESAKRWRREKSFEQRLKIRFALTVDAFEAIWTRQGGRCAMCDVVMQRKGGARNSMHIDHDHGTGRVRELLCMLCNNALGSLRDDIEIARSAVAYLAKHQARSET